MMGTEAKKFKVGDLVRRIKVCVGVHSIKFGDVGTVACAEHGWLGLKEFPVDGDRVPFDGNNFELVEQPAKWVPKVGDRVKYKDALTEGVGFIHSLNESGSDKNLDWYVSVDRKDSLAAYYHNNTTRMFSTSALSPAPATLTTTEGKFYKTRDGRKVGPLQWKNGVDGWIVNVGDGSAWNKDGSARPFAVINDDLIAEWVEEPAAAPAKPKFKVGDRVRSLVNWNGTYKGDILPITDIKDNGVWATDREGENTYLTYDEFELVTTGHTAIVAMIENGVPKPSTAPFVHATEAAAATEAARLARKHKGQQFGVYVLTTTSQEAAPTYEHEWQMLAANGNKIGAIKAIRAATGLHLATAKTAVEDWLIRAA